MDVADSDGLSATACSRRLRRITRRTPSGTALAVFNHHAGSAEDLHAEFESKEKENHLRRHSATDAAHPTRSLAVRSDFVGLV